MTDDVLAAVAVAAIVVLAVGLAAALVTLNRTLGALRDTADDLRRTTLPLVHDARSSVERASAELDRVDGLLFVLPATFYLVIAFHLV